MTHDKGVFLSFTSGDALDHIVNVGQSNEHLEYINDLTKDQSFMDLDPINQLILLEEMEQHEALQFVMDLHYRTLPQTRKKV